MVRLGRILASVALISVVVLSGCLGGDIDPNVTTYTTIEEQSSHVGSEGGQVALNDGSNVAIPQDTLDEVVMLTLSRKSAQGELPHSIDEDPDSRLISDFYFLQVDKVLNQEHGIVLEFPFESSSPSNQVRVIEVFNIEDETYPRFVDATVNETSGRVRISGVAFFPTESAIQEYETEFPPTEDFGFRGMSFSIGYAAISDADHSDSTFLGSFAQTQSEEGTNGCSIRWSRIKCIGEHADVFVSYLFGTGDDMMEYAHSALQYAESIQRAYSDAGFQTRDKIVVHVSKLIPSDTNGFQLPGLNRMWIKRGLDTSRGGDLNLVINHETVHTMQSVFSPHWWKESSADWIAYYFEPDEEGRQRIRNNTVLLISSSENPFQEPFPPSGLPALGADELYDYSVLIDYAVEAGHLPSSDVIRFINEDYDPTPEFEDIYRDQADGFAQYLAEVGLLRNLANITIAEGEIDGHSSGSVVLSIDVTPLTLPVKLYTVKPGTGFVTFQVSLQEDTNDGGIVIGSFFKNYEGLVDKYNTSLSTSKTADIYLLPFAKGNLDSQLELLVEWQPWSPEEAVTFPDPNLEAAIREAISKPTGDIYQSDLDGLTSLDADSRNIVNLSGLEYCTKLAQLDLYNNQISDIQAFANLTSLTDLNLRYNQISDIQALSNLTSLTDLNLMQNNISDIQALSNLTSLTELNLNKNQISDIQALSNLTSLTFLNLGCNQISDTQALSNLTSLTELNLRGNQISDIQALSNLTSLECLVLMGNQISDIQALSNLTSLTSMYLGYNQISDIQALSNLTSLTFLYLDENQISDIQALSNLTSLTRLVLSHNQISDISPLVQNEGLGTGDEVLLKGNPLNSDSINIYIPQLEARGVVVYY